jgi:pyruvate dehydrogenase E2 component (dihydrolipoamide acetyltransferase)
MAGKKSSNPNEFILPDLGEGVHEAELISWKVQVGQSVDEHQILAEMETDKALVEVPSPRPGVIASLHGNPGEILHVGNVLVTYAGDGGSNGASEPKPAAKSAEEPVANSAPEHHEDAGTVVGAMSASAAGVSAEPGKALATPAVRRLARDLGVDIDSVKGTGIGGRVLEKDVRGATNAKSASPSKPAPARAAAAPASFQTPASAPAPKQAVAPAKRDVPSIPAGQDTLRIPFRGVRRTIANRLRESVNQAVHFNVMDEADISALDVLRKKLSGASGEKISVLPFVASALCRVLTKAEFRALNATVDEKPGDAGYDASIIQHRAVHMGIATDTESGLMVPVIRDCDALGVIEIARQIAGIAAAARDRSIARENLMGSTFTISNVGSHAGRFATPIINYPEAAILAVGRARPAPVIRSTSAGPAFAVGNLLPLSLACDHRVVDGATAALALAKIIELLHDPEQLLGPARG